MSACFGEKYFKMSAVFIYLFLSSMLSVKYKTIVFSVCCAYRLYRPTMLPLINYFHISFHAAIINQKLYTAI